MHFNTYHSFSLNHLCSIYLLLCSFPFFSLQALFLPFSLNPWLFAFIPTALIFVHVHLASTWTTQIPLLNFSSSTHALEVQPWKNSCPQWKDNSDLPGLTKWEHTFILLPSSYHWTSLLYKLFCWTHLNSCILQQMWCQKSADSST